MNTKKIIFIYEYLDFRFIMVYNFIKYIIKDAKNEKKGDTLILKLIIAVIIGIVVGIFAVGAPGVPGGTVLTSLGIIISVLGFDENGTALILTIFALQDSFGTACNITGDGALALILNGIFKKK